MSRIKSNQAALSGNRHFHQAIRAYRWPAEQANLQAECNHIYRLVEAFSAGVRATILEEMRVKLHRAESAINSAGCVHPHTAGTGITAGSKSAMEQAFCEVAKYGQSMVAFSTVTGLVAFPIAVQPVPFNQLYKQDSGT